MLQAMGCFNEMLSRNCVPPNFDEYLLKLFEHTKELLQNVTRSSTDGNPLEYVPNSARRYRPDDRTQTLCTVVHPLSAAALSSLQR